MILACVEHAVRATPPNPDAGIIALTVGFGSLALAVYGAGFVAFVRVVRERAVNRPAPRRRGGCLKCWMLG